jgi:hypothetical protein
MQVYAAENCSFYDRRSLTGKYRMGQRAGYCFGGIKNPTLSCPYFLFFRKLRYRIGKTSSAGNARRTRTRLLLQLTVQAAAAETLALAIGQKLGSFNGGRGRAIQIHEKSLSIIPVTKSTFAIGAQIV